MRTILLFMLALLVLLVSTVSATDYYVSVNGDNSSDGLTIATAWQNVSYAVQNTQPNDTIYLINGTWYDEHVVFTHNYTIIKAYNGTPTLDGIDKTGHAINMNGFGHSLVSGLKIRNYYSTVDMHGSYNTVSDCELSDTGGVVILTGRTSHHNTIENCTLHNSGWNTIQVSGNQEPPNGNGIPATHITIRNNTIYASYYHAGIDLYGNLQYVTIEGNDFYDLSAEAVFTHDSSGTSGFDHQEYLTIRNNTFHDRIDLSAIVLGNDSYCIIENNIFNNLTYYPIYIQHGGTDNIFRNNSLYNTPSPRAATTGLSIWESNYINDDAGMYMSTYGADIIVRNPIGKKSIDVAYSASATLEFDDNTVFEVSLSGNTPAEYTPPRYYPDRSNASITAGSNYETAMSPTIYPMTVRPTTGYATVTVISFNTSLPKGDVLVNFTANTTDGNNVIFTVSTLEPFTTYLIKKDSVNYTSVISNSSGFIQFSNSVWSEHIFTIEESGFSPLPNHIYIGVVNRVYTNNTVSWINRQPTASDVDVSSQFTVVVS